MAIWSQYFLDSLALSSCFYNGPLNSCYLLHLFSTSFSLPTKLSPNSFTLPLNLHDRFLTTLLSCLSLLHSRKKKFLVVFRKHHVVSWFLNIFVLPPSLVVTHSFHLEASFVLFFLVSLVSLLSYSPPGHFSEF